MAKYLLKYDLEGCLVLYAERSGKKNAIESFMKVDDNYFVRYDKFNGVRSLTKFFGKCMLAQRFQAEESWVTIVERNRDLISENQFPKKRMLVSFDDDTNIRSFTTNKAFLSLCTSRLGTSINRRKA